MEEQTHTQTEVMDDCTNADVVHFLTVLTCKFQLPETETPQELFTSNSLHNVQERDETSGPLRLSDTF